MPVAAVCNEQCCVCCVVVCVLCVCVVVCVLGCVEEASLDFRSLNEGFPPSSRIGELSAVSSGSGLSRFILLWVSD